MYTIHNRKKFSQFRVERIRNPQKTYENKIIRYLIIQMKNLRKICIYYTCIHDVVMLLLFVIVYIYIFSQQGILYYLSSA